MAGYCSLVILCIGAAAALSAMALVAIAAFTDHWVEVETIFFQHFVGKSSVSDAPDEYLCPGTCGPGGGEGGGQGRRAGDRLLLQAQGALQGLLSWHRAR